VRKTGENSSVEQIAYIPEQYAKQGEYVKIKEGMIWTDGWQVMSVGHSTENPPDWRKAIRGHRNNTGDSLPPNEKSET
jgi:hypothetical protein